MNAADDDWDSPDLDTPPARQRRMFHSVLYLMLILYVLNSKHTAETRAHHNHRTFEDGGKGRHDDKGSLAFYNQANEEDLKDFMSVLNQGFENQTSEDLDPHVEKKRQTWDVRDISGNYRGHWMDPKKHDGKWKPQILTSIELQGLGDPYIKWDDGGMSDLDIEKQQFVEGTNEEVSVFWGRLLLAGGPLPSSTAEHALSKRKDIALLVQGAIFHKYNRVSAVAGLSATNVELVWDINTVNAEEDAPLPDSNSMTEEKQDDVTPLHVDLVTLNLLPVVVLPASEEPHDYRSINLGVVGGNDAKYWKDRSDPWRFFERGNNGKNCEFLLNLQNNVQTTSTTKTPSAWAQTISGELTCINCSFNAVLEVKKNRVDFQTLYPKAVHYCLLATAMCLFQIYFIVKQINYSQTQAAAARISLLCISLQAVLDAFLCVAHLITLFWHPLLVSFSSVAFLKLILFCVFEMRYMIYVSQAHFPQSYFEGGVMARRQIASVHARLYTALAAILLLLWYMPSVILLVLLGLHSFWIPQITWNAIHDTRGALHPLYLFGMSATRLFIPAYFYGCPENLIRSIGFVNYSVEIGWWRTSMLVLWMGIQVTVMFFQDKFGPRFFVPKQFLPVKYDYRRPIPSFIVGRGITSHDDEAEQLISRGKGSPSLRKQSEADVVECDLETGVGSLECSICCAEVETTHQNYMITPCHHVYHPECLTRWMEIKLECPSCRASLPPE